MYKLKIKTSFDAAHRLEDYESENCSATYSEME